MKRRDFIKKAAVGAAAGTAITGAPFVHAAKTVHWRMATSWPTILETLFGGAKSFSQRLSELTDGKFQVRAYAAGELVGGLQVFDAVQAGTVEMGHTASYYYIGKTPALAFDTAVPFGMTTRQQNAWMYYGGGSELLNKEVFSNFNMVAFPGGNTTTQMGGWFRKQVNSVDDLKGLKMRIPGFGGKVMSTLGVNVQTLAAGEIYQALERGLIDATEFVGPYDDQKLKFYEVAKNYYYPSWWEPSAMFSIYVNADKFNKLPKEFKHAIAVAAAESNVKMVAHYDYLNPIALRELLSHGVTLRKFSDDIMAAAQKNAFAMYEDLADKDKTWAKIYKPWKKFRDSQYAWFNVAEQGFDSFAFPTSDLKNL